MGFRFRQRIKLAPGINLNIGLGGLSLSAGVRGASVTLGKRGLRGNVGIPGSGLSYSSQLASFKKNGASRSQNAESIVERMQGFRLGLDARNNIQAELDMGDGFQGVFADKKCLVQIKASYGEKIQDWLTAHLDEKNFEMEALSSIHEQAPSPGSLFNQIKSFTEAAPVRVEPPPPNLLERLNPFTARNYAQSCEAAETNHQRALVAYNQARDAHDAYMKLIRDRQRKVQVGDETAMSELFSDRMAQIAWPKETFIDFELEGEEVLSLLIDLPEIEDMPTHAYSLQAESNGLEARKLTQAERNQMYSLHVHGIAVRIVAEALAVLPTLNQVVFSGYTQRQRSAGPISDDYVLSFVASKDEWRTAFPSLLLNPAAISQLSLVRLRPLASGKLNPITPFHASDLV